MEQPGDQYQQTQIRYRIENAKALIELRLHEARQLFDTRDPAPFIHRDLDPDAVDYLVSAAREVRGRLPFKVLIHVADGQDGSISEDQIQKAFHSYFEFESQFIAARLSESFRRAYISLSIAVVVLFSAIALSHLIHNRMPEGLWNRVLSEGFAIMGWVAMWKPLELLLYEWWPILDKKKLFARLAQCEIEVKFSSMDEKVEA